SRERMSCSAVLALSVKDVINCGIVAVDLITGDMNHCA
ncbi:MAG: hypothetical protein ACI9I0_001433, partial [Rhodoferax sp.]